MSLFKKLSTLAVTIAVSALLLLAISMTQSRLDNIIKEKELRFTGQIKNAPPIVTFTTMALGSFRGILADLLWLRAASLQDQGNYFEMVQLATWVTELQPKFSGAAAYLAWNMAYNISVTCSSFADRWRWVQSGIKLLRDRAIVYNPNDPTLYRELGWIFQHKIGNVLDDANLYYKNQLAIGMMKVIGYKPNWEAMAKAPANMKEFKKAYPKNSRLWKALDKSGIDNIKALFKDFKKHEKLPEAFVKALNDPKMEQNLIYYFRRRWLMEKYRLNASLINELNHKYGELDWRLPEAQAIYWATMGLKVAPDHHDINCERMITQGLKDAFMRGRLMMVDPKAYASIITVPNLNVVDAVIASYDKGYEDNDNASSFRSGKINFMKDAITVLYNYGKIKKAKELYQALRKEEPGKKEYRVSLEAFVMRAWAADIRDATSSRATEAISGLLDRSCYFLLYGDIDAALARERLARYVYRKYMQSHADTLARNRLAPYQKIKEAVIKRYLNSPNPMIAKLFKAKLAELQARSKKESGSAKAGKSNAKD